MLLGEQKYESMIRPYRK